MCTFELKAIIMKLFGIIIVIIGLAVATDAGAQHCGTVQYRQHVPYVAPVVVQEAERSARELGGHSGGAEVHVTRPGRA